MTLSLVGAVCRDVLVTPSQGVAPMVVPYTSAHP